MMPPKQAQVSGPAKSTAPPTQYAPPQNRAHQQANWSWPQGQTQGQPNYDQRTQAQWQAVQDLLGQGLDAKLQDINSQQSLNARRAAEMGAVSGMGGLGGAAQSGQLQAQLGGQALRQQALQDYNNRAANANMNWLDMLNQRAGQEDQQVYGAEQGSLGRDLQRDLQANASEAAVLSSLLGADSTAPLNTFKAWQEGQKDYRERAKK
jgi:hypothetical protein